MATAHAVAAARRRRCRRRLNVAAGVTNRPLHEISFASASFVGAIYGGLCSAF